MISNYIRPLWGQSHLHVLAIGSLPRRNSTPLFNSSTFCPFPLQLNTAPAPRLRRGEAAVVLRNLWCSVRAASLLHHRKRHRPRRSSNRINSICKYTSLSGPVPMCRKGKRGSGSWKLNVDVAFYRASVRKTSCFTESQIWKPSPL